MYNEHGRNGEPEKEWFKLKVKLEVEPLQKSVQDEHVLGKKIH